ncbi:P-loop containing nucleoside triphosphate hydrolase protein [Cladochytrium replicatum]|nr:P-loop containing nucleoside triphosphate hydrolase protein [Cladochytrium replicatum]
MKGALKKLFTTKDKTAKTAKKESAVISVQSLSPLTNDTVLLQLELPPDITFSDFAAAAVSKLDLASHRFDGHSPHFFTNTAGEQLSILDTRDVANALMAKSRVFVEWRVREIPNSSLPLPFPVPPTTAKWICKEHRKANHDIFVSYRRENEEDLVKTLVPYLEKVGKRRLGNKMSVFWDQKCLNDAQNWREGFINGLQQSRVIVYLLSAESFTTMNQNVLAGKEDNVLIEIEKGIELAEKSPNVRLCPVLLDTIDGDGNVVALTKLPKFDPVLQSFSNDQHVCVFSPDAFVITQSRSGKTLCDTISRLFQNNCIHLTPTEGKLYEVAYNVIDLVRPLSEVTSDNLGTLPEPPVHFVGRSNILSDVQMQLVNHGAAILVAQGGMGKSSIALMYAKQHGRSYDSIFWIPCNTAATAISALRGYAGSHFHLTTFETIAPEDLVRFMSDKLSRIHCYLLILDNVDDESVLDQVLGSVILRGDVLVTSRSNSSLEVKMRKWVDPLVKSIQVETWSSDVSEEFLMQRLRKTYQYLISSQSERFALDKLLEHIDGLPLAAEQAAAFMERLQCSFSDLVVRINSYLPQDPDSRVGIVSLSLSAIVKAGLDTIGPAASKFFHSTAVVIFHLTLSTK